MTAHQELDFVSCAEDAAPRLRRLGFLITGDWHLAEDLTQDALIRMYSVWGRGGKEPRATNKAPATHERGPALLGMQVRG